MVNGLREVYDGWGGLRKQVCEVKCVRVVWRVL